MKYYKEYEHRELTYTGKRNKIDTTIYTFDIETTSYLILDGKQIEARNYLDLNDEEQKNSIKQSCMYIWMLGINDIIYYGRTWTELKDFISIIDNENPKIIKYIFVHNLAFEFQYLKQVFDFEEVIARKSRKVMRCKIVDMNIIFRCTYYMTNTSLATIPKLFKLPVAKKVGDLDYSLIRHSKTPLSEIEMGYCEYDCLVLYHYILSELETYGTLNNIPNTSTGKVRRELQEIVRTDFNYKRKVNRAINTDPHVYNLLVEAFTGGYTHANWIYTDQSIPNVDSYDEASAYPYILVTHKFPSSEFKKANIKDIGEISERLCYLFVVRFHRLDSRYYNNIISASKCRYIKGAVYDNGRISSCKECVMVLTEVDLKIIFDWYNIGSYEILESYYATKAYLPKTFINFVLNKYVTKTELKNVKEKELEYSKEKNKFNSLYGMAVTNVIRDHVEYNNETKSWEEYSLTNDEIIEMLVEEKKKSFLSFTYGIYVTSYARDKLLRLVKDLDSYVIYCDTDSIKVREGYNRELIDRYNKSVEKKINYVSKVLGISKEKYEPKDKNGIKHLMGIFEFEVDNGKKHTYDYFITQGAKKYAFQNNGEIGITVSGVPKKNGAKAIQQLSDFKDNFVFQYEYTNKHIIYYCEDEEPFSLTDYKGETYLVEDKSGCCLLPTTYVLKKALEYVNFISNESSKRAIYKEGEVDD